MRYVVRVKDNKVKAEHVNKLSEMGTILDVASNRGIVIIDLEENRLNNVKGLDFVESVEAHPHAKKDKSPEVKTPNVDKKEVKEPTDKSAPIASSTSVEVSKTDTPFANKQDGSVKDKAGTDTAENPAVGAKKLEAGTNSNIASDANQDSKGSAGLENAAANVNSNPAAASNAPSVSNTVAAGKAAATSGKTSGPASGSPASGGSTGGK